MVHVRLVVAYRILKVPSVYLQRMEHPVLLLKLVLEGLHLRTGALVLFGVQCSDHLQNTHAYAHLISDFRRGWGGGPGAVETGQPSC